MTNVFMSLFGGGMLFSSLGDGFLTILLPLVSAALFAIPFWSPRKYLIESLSPLLDTFLKGVTILPFVLVTVSLIATQGWWTQQAGWGPWQVALLTLTVLFGLFMLGCGWGIGRNRVTLFGLKRALQPSLILSGTCFASFVLLPLGLLGLLAVYGLLGAILLRAAAGAKPESPIQDSSM